MSTDAEQRVEGCKRAQRADARRNRQRVLDAAARCFAEDGSDAAVAEIARRAGVGTGTLFRHFPTKHDLLVAVMEERFASARATLEAALAEPDPWAAFALLLADGAELQVRNRCLMEAKTPEIMADPTLARMRAELLAGVRTVVERAQAAGVVRDDVVAEDVSMLMGAVASTAGQLGAVRPDVWRRYLAVVLEGLRPSDRPLGTPPPSFDDLDVACRALRGP
jgi:AcrR family transcriptional regulator